MKQKQWVWLIIAAVVFAGVGVAHVVSATWRQNNAVSMTEGLWGSLNLFSEADAPEFPQTPFVARVNIEGTIMREDMGGLLGMATEGYDHAYLLDYIDRLQACPDNVGLLLYINSGGGEMGASDEVYLKLLDYKESTGRPIYAYFADTACSGAYYIAMAADEIYANRNSLCVNIGVYISATDLSGLFEKYGVESVMIRSSENKGIGAMGEPWTEEHRAIYQSIVDLYYAQFVDVVAAGRGITPEQVKEKNDGREMLAQQALDVALIDGISRYEDYEARVQGYFADEVEVYEEIWEEAVNPFDLLMDSVLDKVNALRGTSDLEMLSRFARTQKGYTVMAYAG